MSFRVKFGWLVLVVFLVVGCAEQSSSVLPQATVVETATVVASFSPTAVVPTSIVVNTPLPTVILTLTPTQIVANTALPTVMPTQIVAPTPTPELFATPTLVIGVAKIVPTRTMPTSVPATPTRRIAPIFTAVPAATPTRIVPIFTAVPATAMAKPTVQPTVVSLASPIGTPDGEEQAFLVQFNEFRKLRGQKPLEFDPLLYQSAKWMAQDMATKNYISHTDSLGRSVTDRIRSFGYKGGWVGENIAGGFEHATDNLEIWQSDDIHINNMLGQYYTKVGVARYYFKGSLNGWHWVLDMGTN